jgi:hypothetical protein
VIQLLISFVFIITTELVFAAQPQNTVESAPVKSWIKPLSVSTNLPPRSEDSVGGVAYVLVDRQVKIEDKSKVSWFYHNVNYVVAQSGLSYASQLNLEFDPSYQKIALNQLTIHRRGQKINKLKSAKISLIQRERELENQIYDGALTANINLDDVQVGDFIESAYTLEGENPVFADTYSDMFSAQWNVPVQEAYIRILWLKPNPPSAIRVFNSEKPIEHTELPQGHEYRFHQKAVAAKNINSETPSWFRPYTRVEISDYADWHQVREWATTLYEPLLKSNPVIRGLANDIRVHNATSDEQIVAALQLVQGQVRYLGIETGVNSHKPSAPADTWLHKYGDCKDKTTLFVAILRELGIKAFPALVHSDLRKSVEEKLPSPQAFNHVITKVINGDQTYWLDPTRLQQYGPLDKIYQSRYGYALVIAQDNTNLEAVEPIKASEQRISTDYFISADAQQPIELQIRSEFVGRAAEKVRNDLYNRSLADFSDAYLNFYKLYFPGIYSNTPLEFKDDKISGKITAIEKYKVDNFWEKNSADRLVGTFPADALLAELKLPEERARNSPYTLSFPNQVYQKIQVHLKPSVWNFEKEKNLEDNDFFYFKRHVAYLKDTNILEIEYIFSTKTEFIPTERIDEYIEAVKRAKDFSEYAIYESTEISETNFIDTYFYLICYCGFIGICLITFGLVCWLRLKDKETNSAALAVSFYPVHIVRFLILNLVTLGGYQTYYMWMNWRYIRRHDQSNIFPFARAILSPIWIYSYYRRITSGEERASKQLPTSKLSAIIFSILFVLTMVLSSIEKLGLYQLLFICMNLILAGLLAWQVINYKQGDPASAEQLSKWKVYHYLLIAVFLPFCIAGLGGADNLFSGQTVLAKTKISKVCTYYLRHNEVFSNEENPQLFYSTGWLHIFGEGFGATDSAVFSYWHEAGELQFKKIPFTNILEIKLAETENEDSSYAISVIDSRQNETKLFVTSTGNSHKAFYRKLVALWKARKGNADYSGTLLLK